MSSADRALCEFAVRLTREPSSSRPEHLDALRAEGLSDTGIHDAVQVIALFNYYTRMAEGLGVELEPEDLVRPWGEMGLIAET